jgi:hypothetical protein
VNIEKGMKRIVWIVSLVGVLFAVIGLGIGTYNLGQRFFKVHRATELTNSPNYQDMSVSDKVAVLRLVTQELRESYPLYAFYAVPIGASWFIFVWGAFFLTRWIVRGFLDN